MAKIGLDNLYYAPITDDANDCEVYGTPIRIAGAISLDITINTSETPLSADGECVDTVAVFNSGTLSINIADITSSTLVALTGGRIDKNGVLIQTGESTPPAVAIGFRSKKANGIYRYVWLYRVVFTFPASSYSTKSDMINLTPETLVGKIYRRKKTDGQGTNPWQVGFEPTPLGSLKGLSQTVDLNSLQATWFSHVYEPDEKRSNIAQEIL